MTYLRSIPECPASYAGSLSDLYQRWIRSVLVPSNVVEAFHRQFTEYLQADNPLFLTRNVGDQERGATVITADGECMRPTDNAPAWWVHCQPFVGGFQDFKPFRQFIESVPCHMFEVCLRDNITAQDDTSRRFSM